MYTVSIHADCVQADRANSSAVGDNWAKNEYNTLVLNMALGVRFTLLFDADDDDF